MQLIFPCFLLVTPGYLVITSGYLNVTTGYFLLLPVPSGYFWFLVLVATGYGSENLKIIRHLKI